MLTHRALAASKNFNVPALLVAADTLAGYQVPLLVDFKTQEEKCGAWAAMKTHSACGKRLKIEKNDSRERKNSLRFHKGLDYSPANICLPSGKQG